MAIQATIAAWHANNKHTSNPLVHVAELLAKSADMNHAKFSVSIDPMRIVKIADRCLRAALKDVKRLSADEEKKSIKAVQAAAKSLAEALQGAQILGVDAPMCALDGSILFVAWTSECAKAIDDPAGNSIPVLPLPGMLRILQSQCSEMLKAPPAASTLTRKTDDEGKAARRAFVVHLASSFQAEFGKYMQTNIANIANAVFQLDDPISVRYVEKLIPKAPLKGGSAKG